MGRLKSAEERKLLGEEGVLRDWVWSQKEMNPWDTGEH